MQKHFLITYVGSVRNLRQFISYSQNLSEQNDKARIQCERDRENDKTNS